LSRRQDHPGNRERGSFATSPPVASAPQASQGKATKMEQGYEYLTGPHFKQIIEALKEAFEGMMEDLSKEKLLFQNGRPAGR
jgi:hypothetical protein